MRNNPVTEGPRYGGDAGKRFNHGSPLNFVDPMYWLAFILCFNVLNPKDEDGNSLPLSTRERNIVMQNVTKHRWVLWISLVIGITTFIGIKQLDDDREAIQGLVSVLLAPAFVTGAAWFAISFGGIQDKLLVAALGLTKWMFAAFTGSMVVMGVAVSFILPIPITCVLCVIIAMTAYAAITYDNVDALKIGLDDALRKQSLTMLSALNDLGYETKEEDSSLGEDVESLTPEDRALLWQALNRILSEK